MLAPGWLWRALSGFEASRRARLVARARLRRARGHVRARAHARRDDRSARHRAAVAAVAVRFLRGWPATASVPGRYGRPRLGRGRRACSCGGWRRRVAGDGLFHLARARKLLELDSLSLDRISEFADGSLHPGYAFPLWHGFLALIARSLGDGSGAGRRAPALDPRSARRRRRVRGGWALFRRTWAAGAVAAAQVAMICFAPGQGGAYVFLALPATSSRQLLVPAALALALETVRRPSVGLVASTAAAGLALAVVHPRMRSSSGSRSSDSSRCGRCGREPTCARGSRLSARWSFPPRSSCSGSSRSWTTRGRCRPTRDELRRAFEQYRGQLDVRSDTVYSLAAEVFTAQRAGRDRGAAARSRSPASPRGGAGRRTWSEGRSRCSRSCSSRCSSLRSPISSRSRRLVARPASFRSRSRSPAGSACSSTLVGRLLLPLALGAGIVAPDRLSRGLRVRARGHRARAGSCGSRSPEAWSRSSSGSSGAGPPLEAPRGAGRGAVPPPVVVGRAAGTGTARRRRERARCLTGLVEAVRENVSTGCDRLLGSGDELPPRRVRAGVHRRRAARACRGHGGEPAVRACPRRAAVPADRRPLDPARATAPSTSSSTERGSQREFELSRCSTEDERFMLYRFRPR